MTRMDRITTNPAFCHGQRTVRGLRYPVENLLELLASGMSIEEIIEDHPDLDRDDLLTALEFGALASGTIGWGPAPSELRRRRPELGPSGLIVHRLRT